MVMRGVSEEWGSCRHSTVHEWPRPARANSTHPPRGVFGKRQHTPSARRGLSSRHRRRRKAHMEDKFAGLLKRLEAVTTKLETVPAGGAGAAPPAVGGAPPAVEDEAVPPMVVAFDDFLNGTVAAYVAAAGAINMPEVCERAHACVSPTPRTWALIFFAAMNVCFADCQAGWPAEAGV